MTLRALKHVKSTTKSLKFYNHSPNLPFTGQTSTSKRPNFTLRSPKFTPIGPQFDFQEYLQLTLRGPKLTPRVQNRLPENQNPHSKAKKSDSPTAKIDSLMPKIESQRPQIDSQSPKSNLSGLNFAIGCQNSTSRGPESKSYFQKSTPSVRRIFRKIPKKYMMILGKREHSN